MPDRAASIERVVTAGDDLGPEISCGEMAAIARSIGRAIEGAHESVLPGIAEMRAQEIVDEILATYRLFHRQQSSRQ